MKAAGQTADHKARPMADALADDGGEARDDIARLLRALNDDLKADPAEEDDLLSPDAGRKAERHLPIGKIAAALAAAIGIGAVVVMLDQGGEAPSAPPAPLITAVPSAPAPGGGSPGGVAPAQAQAKPEPLITRAAPVPTQQPPMQTQTVVAPAAPAPAVAPPPMAPPPMALPQIPPPAMKVPEPPALPSPAPTAAKPADPAPHPVETAESARAPAHPPASTLTTPSAEPAKAPPPLKTTETAELQAMLSAPPPPAAAQRQAAAARPAPQPAKPAPKTASTPPAAAPATAPSSGVLTPPASAAVPDGRYTVQVGSFQQADNAEGLVRRLRGLGFNAYALDWTDAEQRSWHVVRVGGYADTAAARQAAASLKGKVEAQPIVVSTR
ncbi:SPOR domain-containing protein [Azospirillum argentinense]|uniref:SPOR domain-containing protein n=2 Tax=Azospirillum argentinense TaxID=2970906 RepID=A0A4D8PAZ8_9PROT|nr:SPOR domain-containing protein [Azospirillum argentinense]